HTEPITLEGLPRDGYKCYPHLLSLIACYNGKDESQRAILVLGASLDGRAPWLLLPRKSKRGAVPKFARRDSPWVTLWKSFIAKRALSVGPFRSGTIIAIGRHSGSCPSLDTARRVRPCVVRACLLVWARAVGSQHRGRNQWVC